jgi:alpha-glucuronidase
MRRETGTLDASFSKAWLAYLPLPEGAARDAWSRRLAAITPPGGGGPVLSSALRELESGIEALLGAPAGRGRAADPSGAPNGLVLRRLGAGAGAAPESFAIEAGEDGVALSAADDSGFLYGAFRLLQLVARGTDPAGLRVSESPRRPLRMIDHWDNLDGSVERGYAGTSLFFRDGKVLPPSPRLEAYARLMASVGINAAAINNVNVHRPETELVYPRHLRDLAKVAAVLRPWGVKLFLSANFAAPVTMGELDAADPLDPRVAAWWEERARIVWKAIPDFGGFVVKADSEGRPGPFTYGRDHADGANLIARAIAPFGGKLLWRCFVYDCRQDWRDRRTDRARAAYDTFAPLDGRFLPNVYLQVKNGPMDFQPREPVSPLFGAMPGTRKALELQAAQEYTGQQRHVCFLPEQWRVYLDTEIREGPEGALRDVADAFAAVSNLGDDPNWCGHDLAQANWYGFGRLAWDPGLGPDEIAREWAALTFGTAPGLAEGIASFLLGTWRAYEAYTAPLGVGWMVNPSHHYGPNPDGYEYDRWGTYHFADREGVGVDRTAATGSGYAGQYRSALAEMYGDPASCPDELMLFFHHLPYGHRLHSGKTVIQHVYDAHFEGAEAAAALSGRWEAFESRIPAGVYAAVKDRLTHQAEHAALWRDVVNTFFFRLSGVPDEKGRTIYR